MIWSDFITFREQSAEQVTGWCRSPAETRRGSPTGSVASAAVGTPSRHLSDADKLRKVLLELVDTERTYVKVSAITHPKDVSLESRYLPQGKCRAAFVAPLQNISQMDCIIKCLRFAMYNAT